MTPGTLVLLAEPGRPGWSGVAALLRSYGWNVLHPAISEAPGSGYVARAALAIGAAVPEPPLLLVAMGAIGPLLPALASAQRAAHRTVGGYVVVDADLAADRDVDWPDAPCGYLGVSPEHGEQARIAGLRGWPVGHSVTSGDRDVAEALRELVARL